MGLGAPSQATYTVPALIKILNFSGGERPVAAPLEDAAKYLAEQNVFPVGYPEASSAQEAASYYERALRRAIHSSVEHVIIGTHVRTTTSQDGLELHMPFIRLKPIPDTLRTIAEQVRRVMHGEVGPLEDMHWERFGDGRILVDYKGIPAAAIFAGPNALLYNQFPDTCWYLSTDAKASPA